MLLPHEPGIHRASLSVADLRAVRRQKSSFARHLTSGSSVKLQPVPVLLMVILACAVSFLFGLEAGRSSGMRGVQWRFSEAAGRGEIGEMERLHAEGALIDEYPSAGSGNLWGSTALMSAASSGEPRALEWLLERGADPNRAEGDGMTPLDAAVGRSAAAKRAEEVLIRYGAKRSN